MRHSQQKSGFALIVSLTLMAFVLLLMLSLSAIIQVETQSASIVERHEQAKKNALLGLQIAIGEVQNNLGADQRISARADLFDNTDVSKRHMTGIWSSVAGARVGGQTYQEGEFIRWLASGSGDEAWRGQAFNVNTSTVTLVGAGSLADSDDNGIADDPDDVVIAELEPILEDLNGGSVTAGHYAWWVGDEGVKARINVEDQTLDSVAANPVEKKLNSALALNSSGRSDVGVLAGLQTIDIQDDGLAGRVSKLADVALGVADSNAALDVVNGYFHDLTTVSSGVLADVRNGGLKQDLSLAFEMNDSDFNASVFGSAGPDTVMSTGFGRVQPIFRTGQNGDANGPTWHVLRDYYSIYKRMDDVMADPVFDAQALGPNNDALANITTGQFDKRKNLASMRYISEEATSDSAITSDPLRNDGGIMPIPVKASYLPYVQRHITTFGASFTDMPSAPGLGNHNHTKGITQQMLDDTDEWHVLQLRVRPAIVVHNPYNVKIRHNGMSSAFETLRFSAAIESDLEPDIVYTQLDTKNNSHMLNTAPDVLSAGEVKIYSGIAATGQDVSGNFTESESGLLEESDFIILKSKDWKGNLTNDSNIFGKWYIPSQTGVPNNIRMITEPHSVNGAYTYGAYHSIRMAGAVGVDTEIEDIITANGFQNYAGIFTRNVTQGVDFWYSGEDDALVDVEPFTTEDYSFEFGKETDVNPRRLIEFDMFLKPATTESDINPYPYLGFSHSNPLAPIWQSSNLFDTDHSGGSAVDYGLPVLSPNWQLTIRRGANFVDELRFDPASPTNGYWGGSNDNSGQTHVAAIELPTSPPLSLGQLQNANVSLYAHMPALAIGNSFASPYMPRSQTYIESENLEGNDRAFYDLSYLCNEVLWDSYFFSSYSVPYDDGNDNFQVGEVQDTFDAAFDSSNQEYTGWLPNPRMTLRTSDEGLSAIRDKLFENNGSPVTSAYARAAENLMVSGAFNVNSVSVDAWKAVLASARNIPVFNSVGLSELNYTGDTTPLSRLGLPVHGEFTNAMEYYDEEAWGGVSTLTNAEIDVLATAIVDEIRLRTGTKGRPYISMHEFVNRELVTDVTGLTGLLQAAIDKSGINSKFDEGASNLEVSSSDLSSFPNSENIDDAEGDARSTATSAAAYMLQADILQAIGSFSSVRSDTFRIRSYGDYVDPITGDTSRAWCEAVIQRIPKPVEGGATDPSQPNYWIPNDVDLGRDFEIISFRWLNENEV